VHRVNVPHAVLDQLPPDPDPPATLYHYTDARGLDGILREHRLWAHDVDYMNDASEIVHGRSLVQGILAERTPGIANPVIREFFTDYAKKVDSFSTIQVFAACFCECGDLASQWQSYGGGRGYAVGFDAGALVWGFHNPQQEVHGDRMWLLIPVRYDLNEQRQSIIDVIDGHSAEWQQSINANGEAYVLGVKDTLLSRLEGDMAPRILKAKNPVFSQEQEWRAVLLAGQDPVKRAVIKIRVGEFGFVPYIPFDLSRPAEANRLPITKVIFGPTPHPEQTKRGLLQALANAGYAGVEVAPSEVPLRSRPIRE
jgi:hypothetical protein